MVAFSIDLLCFGMLLVAVFKATFVSTVGKSNSHVRSPKFEFYTSS